MPETEHHEGYYFINTTRLEVKCTLDDYGPSTTWETQAEGWWIWWNADVWHTLLRIHVVARRELSNWPGRWVIRAGFSNSPMVICEACNSPVGRRSFRSPGFATIYCTRLIPSLHSMGTTHMKGPFLDFPHIFKSFSKLSSNGLTTLDHVNLLPMGHG